jgi:hypothetical protein
VDLVKFDIEGAEVDVLKETRASDLNSCGQFTAEFHDSRPPLTRRDVDDVCQRMRAARYAIVKPNWPIVDDVLFVNLKACGRANESSFAAVWHWLVRCSSSVEGFLEAVIVSDLCGNWNQWFLP